MSNDWDSITTNTVGEQIVKEVKQPKNQSVVYSDNQIRDILFPDKQLKTKSMFCSLIYGEDGTGKSGLLQSYPLKGKEKMMILDLDGGNEPLLHTYNTNKINNIYVVNPLTMFKDGNNVSIDYKETMNKVRLYIEWLSRNIEKESIKVVALDGLSQLLKYAELQMRLEQYLTPDKGVEYRYWKNRNKMFLELLEQIKSLPIDTFFVSHADFIILEGDEEIAKVKKDTNRMMWQKLRCIRKVLNDKVVYSVMVDKSKYNVNVEGQEFGFLEVDKESKTFNWKGEDVFKLLRGDLNESK
tara:strand:- start:28258 stop:29148 length:891 start_codon:yes stop_codon:yes gene_type:complete